MGRKKPAKIAAKVLYRGTILGDRTPRSRYQQRFVVFNNLDDAKAWCAKHAADESRNAQVSVGAGPGGRVVWRYRGAARRESTDAKARLRAAPPGDAAP